ncbi:Cell envelope-associated transcriptional attenuator LytR-CpsA-Psr [Anaerovibrio sp. JC8]|uniref:LCP family protein n=1 Tax=Anaerovibrio sp. JC8 TaxID=1240085 RepID=UPI000A0D7494|nr:LCP family protein [Anaerovibrio sp. JC8]ORU00603.1 Cell envelope-associated transcriptional attenuator LytR-CpsA-Psr [Anaerovibrio sp. JC8]
MRIKRRRRRDYTRLYILAALICTFAVAALATHWWTHREVQPVVSEAGIETNDKILHIMIMGVDRRNDDVGRSDTLMVLTVNKENGKAELMSVPRDTRVKIEGHGYDKINHAYAYGGHKLTRSTVENLLGIPMDYYVLIDLNSFENIIDALDGIDIDVEKRMYYEDPWDDNGGLVIDLYPGMQHMTGEKAIQYVRFRDGEGDIGRIGRQQHFMKAVMTKMLHPSTLPKLPKIIEIISKTLETDMPLSEMLSLSKLLPQVREQGLESEMLPGTPAFLDDVSYWLPDIISLREMVAEEMGQTLDEKALQTAEAEKKTYMEALPKGIMTLNDGNVAKKDKQDKAETGKQEQKEIPESEKTDKKPAKKAEGPGQISVLVINDSGVNGAGAKMVNKLIQQGFNVTGVDTGNKSDREHTIIVTDGSNVTWFYGMPFPCTIMDGADPMEAVVYVGKDFE